MAEHKWYEDWLLSMTSNPDGSLRIDVEMPHYPIPHLSFHQSDKEEFIELGNLLDRLLSELTGTKKGITDGSDTPAGIGRLGPRPAKRL